MRTISAEQFKNQFGEESYKQFGIQAKRPGYLQRVGTGIKTAITGLKSDLETQAQAIAEQELKTPQTLGEKVGTLGQSALALGRGGLRTAGAVSKAALIPVTEAPGIKQVGEFVGGKLAETTPIQKFTQWAQRHPEAAKDIENVLDISGLLGTAKVAKIGTKAGIKATKGAVTKLDTGLEAVGKKATLATQNIPEQIMTRVARLNPTDEIKFQQVAGKSPGKYLVDTGNFGSPDKVIAREAQKFAQSKQLVDDAISKLPGNYKVGPIDDALNFLVKKGVKVSSPNVKAPFLARAKELLNKHQSQGLNMSEINEVKRIFEREAKLGYNKLTKPNLVAKATNVDSAIRQWQFKKAIELGFENIREMNKQTQISKFLIDKLGDKIIGQQALNNINLTDWIVLAGGDPTAVGAFLTKRFFSSKTIQAKIAKLLSGKSPTIVEPKTLKPKMLESPRTFELPGEGVLEGQTKIKP